MHTTTFFIIQLCVINKLLRFKVDKTSFPEDSTTYLRTKKSDVRGGAEALWFINMRMTAQFLSLVSRTIQYKQALTVYSSSYFIGGLFVASSWDYPTMLLRARILSRARGFIL